MILLAETMIMAHKYFVHITALGNIPNNKIGRLSLTTAILKKGKEGISGKSSQV